MSERVKKGIVQRRNCKCPSVGIQEARALSKTLSMGLFVLCYALQKSASEEPVDNELLQRCHEKLRVASWATSCQLEGYKLRRNLLHRERQ